jgi:enoyl-[acyl-carrier-protein] reductase (NADH)
MAYNLLKGKRGIITGALDENSIAWKVAEKSTRRRCHICINQCTHCYAHGRD